ncbi:MAG: DUF2332 domain-containing protein [Actinomycetota bacterium]|nr:DUF2332 domain-containing protein [Actinomycetota bacterium]
MSVQLRYACELQARLCHENGSPTWAAIVEEIANQLDDEANDVVDLLRSDLQDPVESAVLLRLLGAVHRLLIAGQSDELAQYLPSLGGEVDVLRVVPAFFAFASAHKAAIREGMQAGVQTNEVGRAAVLSAGLRHLTREFGLPIQLLEVGCSAGLNLHLDRYRINTTADSWGPADSAVVLEPDFDGALLGAEVTIQSRIGCDLAPLDARSTADGEKLRSFIWPEDTARLARLEAALSIFESVQIDTCPATPWLRQRLAARCPGVITVVMHSIVMPYLTDHERQQFEECIADAGRRATSDAPLAWLRMEPSDEWGSVILELSTWPKGLHEVLATCTPHGGQIAWRDLRPSTSVGDGKP